MKLALTIKVVGTLIILKTLIMKYIEGELYVLHYPTYKMLARANGKGSFDSCMRGYLKIDTKKSSWHDSRAGLWAFKKVSEATSSERAWYDQCRAAGEVVPKIENYEIY
jgi:hypothetical protein